MTDAPHLTPVDQLGPRVSQASLFERVPSRKLKALLEETAHRLAGLGEDAEAKYQESLAALREAGRDAVEALGEEYAALPEGQYVNRWAVVQLLTDLQDASALDLLNEIISSPIPPERSPDPHASTAGREVVIRTTAVEAVARLAAGGSAKARETLLKHARHPVRSVKIAAAMGYLEQGGGHARNELRRRMPKADHWILGIRRVQPRDVPPIEGHRFLAPRSPAETMPPPAPGGRAAAISAGPSPVPEPRRESTAPGSSAGTRGKRVAPGIPAKRRRARRKEGR